MLRNRRNVCLFARVFYCNANNSTMHLEVEPSGPIFYEQNLFNHVLKTGTVI
jgi:hypothetical protein